MGCCMQHEFRVLKRIGRPGPVAVDAPREERTIVPYEQCIFCTEKHVSDAWDLAREVGYAFPNRQTIIGALGSAERHSCVLWPKLSELIRSVRHLVQLREESKIDWKPVLAEIDSLATMAAMNLKSNQEQ